MELLLLFLVKMKQMKGRSEMLLFLASDIIRQRNENEFREEG